MRMVYSVGLCLQAKRSRPALGVVQAVSQCIAFALLTELLGDLAAAVNEDVSDVAARVLVARDDEVPGVTRIRLSIRCRPGHGFAMGIAEDDERRPGREIIDGWIVTGAWSAPS